MVDKGSKSSDRGWGWALAIVCVLIVVFVGSAIINGGG